MSDEDDDVYEELGDIEPDTEGDPFEELAESEAFVEAGTGIDEDAVWERLTESSEEVRPEDVGEAVVEKAKFCQRCEHFSPPPSVSCGHEGTEIVELVDTDHFRVVNCPVVARRREIGEFE